MALMRTPSAIPATARRRDVRGAYACPFGHAVLFIIVGIQRSDNDDAQAEDDNEHETAIDVLSSFCPPRVAGPPFESTPNVEGTPPHSARSDPGTRLTKTWTQQDPRRSGALRP